MMRVICSTTSSNEYLDGFEYAVVEVNAELVALVRARIEICRAARAADDQFFEAYFWDYRARFYAAGDWSEEREFLDGEWFACGEPPPEDAEARTECDRMVVTVNGGEEDRYVPRVRWKVIPKYGNGYVSTQSISLDELEEMARGTVD